MKVLPLLIASAVVFYSCDKKESSAEEPQEINVSTSGSENDLDNTSSAIAPAGNIGVDRNAAPLEAPAATPFPAGIDKSNGGPALNPAHGQPYHDCAIAVGAPLTSTSQPNLAPQLAAPQQSSANTINTNPVSSFQVPANATSTKPALNPAHGQPNHRCDIAVGAPLS